MKDKPIRVAQIMGKLWAGGVEMVVFNYYREIDKRKVQFDFFYDEDSTVDPPQKLIDMGARFYKIPPYQKLVPYLKTLDQYFKSNKYDIVHSHINTLSVFPLYSAWKAKIPIRIAHNHSVPAGNEVKRNLVKNILRCFSKVFSTNYFSCSEKAGRWLFGNKVFDSGKVFVVKNAIKFEAFEYSDMEIVERKKQMNLEGKFVVGHIGRFTYAKNHRFLIDVFEEIVKMNKDAMLMLVGDGELHRDIVNYIIQKNLLDHVVMVGQVSNPEYYYCLANVILLPSLFEGLSLTAIESQIAGVPVVVSNAIPDEAVISNACQFVDITCGPGEWAKVALNISDMRVELTEKSEEYNIEKRAKILCEWYMKHIELLENRGKQDG